MVTLHRSYTDHVNSSLLTRRIKGALFRSPSTYTVSCGDVVPLVPHYWSSVRRLLNRCSLGLVKAAACLTLVAGLVVPFSSGAAQLPVGGRVPVGSDSSVVQDSIRRFDPLARAGRLAQDTLMLRRPPFFGVLSRINPFRYDPGILARNFVEAVRAGTAARERARFEEAIVQAITAPFSTDTVQQVADTIPKPALVPVRPDSVVMAGRGAMETIDGVADYGINVQSRLESKFQRTRNERCTASQLTVVGNNCFGTFQPAFDYQFSVRSGGVIADRVHVNVDYESTREFDASNNISVFYQGKSDEMIQRLEAGNVSLQAPASRYLTSGIPSGNYGVQMTGQLGPMRFTSIFANQKGNVSKDNVFTVGERTFQEVERSIEDIQIESRRFFFTVDPRQFQGYPNVDVLNRQQMQQLAAALPDSIRPKRLYVYRQLIGAQNQNPRGPQFSVRGAQNPARQIYQLLRENVDYYLDPSQLWISLVVPLNQNTERLAIAYEVTVDGVTGRNVNTGGTPDLEFTEEMQYANLLWEPELQPSNPEYFLREIKSFYRLGGDDLRLESIRVKLVTGLSGDQEKPADPSSGETYLQVFGLSQATNPNQFDVENRVWPRQNDPNFNASGGAANQKLIRDYFIAFPSVQPFSRAGLARPEANPANDTLYSYPNEYLYSAQRPQSIYRMMATYMSEGGARDGSVSLGSLQIRPNSERVVIDGRILEREKDYEISYDIGRITFNRPDTLFITPKQVSVRYEENPLFTAAPTSIFGFTSLFPLERGQFTFTAISQQQRSGLNRPPLGFEPNGSLVAGMTGSFNWEAPQISKLVGKLPIGQRNARSAVSLQTEFAMSKPQPNSAGQAYIESFEADAGITISLQENSWYFSSRPVTGTVLSPMVGADPFTVNRASTLVFQNNAFDVAGNVRTFTPEQIDPAVRIQGSGIQSPEQILWMTLYPLRTGGVFDFDPSNGQRRFAWTIGENTMVGETPTGRRWRSLRTILNPSGADLSRIENVEFFVLLNVERDKRRRNPSLVFDFGDVSENSLVFAPETLTVNRPSRAGLPPDTTYKGKRLVGYDRFDSERDPFSRAFNAATNDVGLPGDRADTIIVVDNTKDVPTVTMEHNVPLCVVSASVLPVLSDSRANCTRSNNRLDEEDIDLDGQLNMRDGEVGREQLKRFVVDLADSSTWTRRGRCTVQHDSTDFGVVTDSLCWVQVRMNWRAPAEEINNPNDRRMRALRMTMISNASSQETDFPRIALAQLKLVGAPWLKRSERPLAGIAGDSTSPGNGFVIASVIGTLDSSSQTPYTSPPGVVEEPENRQADYQNTRIQVNERSMRLQAGASGLGFQPFNRAETYFRFAEGTKSFMGYRTLRLWLRGRGNGWGHQGELNGYIKLGRDENNFYMYRTSVNSGETQSAWEPEVNVDLTRFQFLRSQLENAYLSGSADSLQCEGVDLELVKRSALPRAQVSRRYAVCQDGYIVYTTDPAITPPNLAGVQELAVGIIRVDSVPSGGNAVLPNDTLELWIDDIRLLDVVDDIGFAGEVGLSFNAADLADFRVNLSRRDPNFRQLGETPSFLSANGVNVGTTLHLERMLPARLGIVMPLVIDYNGSGAEQLFLNRSDIRASGIEGLRNPRERRTNYSLSLRKAIPIDKGWYAPFVNGLALNGTWGGSGVQSPFQELKSSNYATTASLVLSDDARHDRLPSVVDWLFSLLPNRVQRLGAIEGFRSQNFRWAPTSFRLSSSLARTSSATTSYTKAAQSLTDTGQMVNALTHVWRNAASMELRPTLSLSGRIDAAQLLDLRDYTRSHVTVRDSLDRRIAANAERLQLLGTDLGLERERSLNTSISYQPSFGTWFRPNLSWNTNFSLVRDPNARALLRSADTSGVFRLPSRIGAIQSLNASTSLDLGRYVSARTADSSFLRKLGSILGPADISWVKSLTANHDNTIFSPGTGMQFGFGDVDDFRGIGNHLAANAGRVRRFTLNNQFNLPLGIALSSRYEEGTSETWTRRSLDGFQALITSEQRRFPDVQARMLLRPRFLSMVFSSLSLDVGYQQQRQGTFVPNETGGIADQSRTLSRSTPVGTSITWAFLGNLVTNARFSRDIREDQRPGSITEGTTERLSVDMSRSWRLPQRWKTRGNMRTSVSYNQEGGVSSVGSLNSDTTSSPSNILPPSILANTGRRAFNFNAGTDLSETTTFQLTGSQIVTFDRTRNSQVAQTVFSVVLQVRFFAGELK